ncbi:transposase [Olsenella profusa]|uniref:Transposase n=1 Tax=Olsenella profusa TaxID=138595 RepID=A0ABS2F1V2_9ACTN|nr:transposase [Olsenella profusa]
MDEMCLGATVPGRVGRGCEKAPLLVAAEAAGPGGPGRCSARVASDVTAGSYREFCRLHVGVLARVRFDGFLPIGCALASWPRAEAGRTPSGGSPGTWLRLAHKVISNLRAYVQGTYHGLSATRLQGAVDEFCWRYSHRAPGGPGIASELLGDAVRGHTPRAELLSSTFAAQGPGGRIRNARREKRENEEWVARATAKAIGERAADYASR